MLEQLEVDSFYVDCEMNTLKTKLEKLDLNQEEEKQKRNDLIKDKENSNTEMDKVIEQSKAAIEDSKAAITEAKTVQKLRDIEIRWNTNPSQVSATELEWARNNDTNKKTIKDQNDELEKRE